jgi:hypothetical protein
MRIGRQGKERREMEKKGNKQRMKHKEKRRRRQNK